MIAKIHFWKGTGIFAWTVRWRTWGDFAHTAIEIDDYVYEAVYGNGTIRTHSDNYTRRPDRTLFIDVGQKGPDLIKWMQDRLGAPYDKWGVLNFLTRRKESGSSAWKWFCSEWVTEALESVEIYPFRRVDASQISPSVLSYSPIFFDHFHEVVKL